MEKSPAQNSPDPVHEKEILTWFSEMGIGFAPKQPSSAEVQPQSTHNIKDAA